MNGKALRKHSLHEKTAASVLFKPWSIILHTLENTSKSIGST